MYSEIVMTEQYKYKLVLPKADGNNTELISNQSVLLIGANGSGKTRLGTWIEMTSPQCKLVHRLSAQKSLSMPDTSTPVSIELAERDLLFGYAEVQLGNEQAYKYGHKWQNKPAISFLNDYQKLMVYLFSNETEESAKYKVAQKAAIVRIEPPKTKMDLVKEVWERILPHRELIVGGLRIQTRVKGEAEKIYNSSEMSDGERVIFYLIGQCLAAPNEGIVVIDEPELHLHKSVQTPLWAEIEKLRPDCLFVYLTHDVDFAAAKEGSKRIWLKSFDGKTWDWEELKEDSNLPNDLLIEVLGSRKPVVFVEGDNGSHDVALYRAILPSFLVIPRGGCSQVIMSVKALKANTQLHHMQVFGIVDRDRRVIAEIQKLEQDSIFVLSVAEVENLFCVKEILQIVSQRLARDANADFQSVSNTIFQRLQDELETKVSLQVASEIKFKLNMFDEKSKGANALTSALQSLADGIDVGKIYSQTLTEFNTAISKKDFENLLSIYNRKSLSSQAGNALGLANGELPEMVVRLAKGKGREEVANALKKYFGNFAPHMT
jgi:ABC-type cobalamin/Fe3+-siderophores transport system ATPase subunit